MSSQLAHRSSATDASLLGVNAGKEEEEKQSEERIACIRVCVIQVHTLRVCALAEDRSDPRPSNRCWIHTSMHAVTGERPGKSEGKGGAWWATVEVS